MKEDITILTRKSENEIYAFRVPASEWVIYETDNKEATETLHKIGVYELVREIAINGMKTFVCVSIINMTAL